VLTINAKQGDESYCQSALCRATVSASGGRSSVSLQHVALATRAPRAPPRLTKAMAMARLATSRNGDDCLYQAERLK
jgi:hypothetical protein